MIIKVAVFVFVCYMLMLEIHPSYGGFWFRVDDTGRRKINIGGFLDIVKQPFKNPLVWNVRFLDMNWIVVVVVVTCIFVVVRKYVVLN